MKIKKIRRKLKRIEREYGNLEVHFTFKSIDRFWDLPINSVSMDAPRGYWAVVLRPVDTDLK